MPLHEQISYPDHIPDRQGRLFFRCGIPGCDFRGRRYINYFDHVSVQHYCARCQVYSSDLASHVCTNRVQQGGGYNDGYFEENSRTHHATMSSFIHEFQDKSMTDVGDAMNSAEDSIENLIMHMLQRFESVIAKIYMVVVMSRDITFKNGFTFKRFARIHFPALMTDIFSDEDVREFIVNSESEISGLITDFTMNGSGWTIDHIESLNLQGGELRLFSAATPGNYIPFPLSPRRGYFNIQETNGKCFQLSVAACLHYDQVAKDNKTSGKGMRKNTSRPSTWEPFLKNYDFSMIRNNLFQDVAAFEMANNVSVNILSHRRDKVIIVRRSRVLYEKAIHLFLIYEGTCPKTATKTHLCPITNLDKFMAKLTHTATRSILCQRCFRRFTTDSLLEKHQEVCMIRSEPKMTAPKAGSVIKFDKWYMRLAYPFICTYNIQAFAVPPSNASSTEPTKHLYTFEPQSYSISLVRNYSDRSELVQTYFYDGENVMSHFWSTVGQISKDILMKIRETYVKIKMTDQERLVHEQKTTCDLCARTFDDRPTKKDGPPEKKKARGVYKCADHDFMTYASANDPSNLRYTCCIGCNNALRYKHECVFINTGTKKFENAFLLKGLDDKAIHPKHIKIIAKNPHDFVQLTVSMRDHLVPPVVTSEDSEKYKCGFRYPKARLMSASRFFDGDIESMIQDLLKDNLDTLSVFKEGIKLLFPNAQEDDLFRDALKITKFPQQAINGPQSLQEGLPGIDSFYDDSYHSECSEEEYSDLMDSCERLGIKTLGHYVKSYSIVQSLLLGCLWSGFSREAYATYKLCPSTVCTLHTYAFQAMLYHTKQVIELPTDPEIVEFLNQPARGGLVTANVRAVFAKHEGLPSHDGHTNDNKIIYSADVTSMFSYIMSSYKFPIGSYNFIGNYKEMEMLDFTPEQVALFDDQDTGFLVECDLKYTENAQYRSEQLPFAPDRYRIQLTDLSEEQQDAVREEQMKGRHMLRRERLCLNFYDKKRYIVDFRTLCHYVMNGMEIVQIHRALSFKTSNFLAPFMQLNQMKRKEAKSDLMKRCFKSISNGIWGMMARSSASDMAVQVCRTRPRALVALASPYFQDFHHINENLSLIFKKKKQYALDKPRAIAYCISDVSKLYFYELFGIINEIFGRKSHTLASMDTDGYLGILQGVPLVQFFDIVNKYKIYFDFGSLNDNCSLFQRWPQLRGYQASKPGCVKLENYMIKSIAIIRPKQQSVEYYDEDGKETQLTKCSGVKKSAIKGVTHEMFLQTAMNNKQFVINENHIQVDNNEIKMVTTAKRAFVNINVCRIFPDPDDINKSFPIGYKA